MIKYLLLIFLFNISSLEAHPHVFVDARVELIFADNKIESIKQEWQFDEFFSMTIIEDYDLDKDGKFSEDEVAKLQKGAFENLKNYTFFNNIFYGDTKIEDVEYTSFNAIINEKNMVYDFTVTLKKPINPLEASIAIGLYDPEFFIDIAYVKDNPVALKNNQIKCDYEIKEDTKNPIFMGFVAPKTVYLKCE